MTISYSFSSSPYTQSKLQHFLSSFGQIKLRGVEVSRLRTFLKFSSICLLIFNRGCVMENLSIKKLGKKIVWEVKWKFKSGWSLLILGDTELTRFLYLTFFAVLILIVCRFCCVLHIIPIVCAWTSSPTSHLLPLFSGCTPVFLWH